MAAVKVLTSKGYYSSTMDDIVAESKMSKGAIYHYYSCLLYTSDAADE